MSEKYILKGHKAIPCDDILEWGKWYEKADRHVVKTTNGDVIVSTVFWGLNHSFMNQGPQ